MDKSFFQEKNQNNLLSKFKMCLTKFKLTDQREVIQNFAMTQGYTGKIFSEKKIKEKIINTR